MSALGCCRRVRRYVCAGVGVGVGVGVGAGSAPKEADKKEDDDVVPARSNHGAFLKLSPPSTYMLIPYLSSTLD